MVYDPSVEMAIDLFPCEDGHAQERALLGEVLSTVQPGDLWIMDRNFCVCAFLTGIKTRQAQFICRQHLGFAFTPRGPKRFIGNSETGRVYEQWIEVVPPDGGDAHRYRRIRVKLKRPTRNGEKELFIVTNLSKSAATATLVAEMYRRRWSIETMFQELEAHLHSEVNTLGLSPGRALCVLYRRGGLQRARSHERRHATGAWRTDDR